MRPPLNIMRIRHDHPKHTFGMVRHGGRRPHQGWDLTAPVGTPVYAITDGVIKETTANVGYYGRQVILGVSRGFGDAIFQFSCAVTLRHECRYFDS